MSTSVRTALLNILLASAAGSGVLYLLWLIRQLWPGITTVIHALVTPRSHCCDALYVWLPLKVVWKVQLLQDIATSILMTAGMSVLGTTLFYLLHWLLPVHFWSHFKLLALTLNAFKCLYQICLLDRLHHITLPTH